jgi:hypothetical protein
MSSHLTPPVKIPPLVMPCSYRSSLIKTTFHVAKHLIRAGAPTKKLLHSQFADHRIMPAPAVSLVPGSTKMKDPVCRLRR